MGQACTARRIETTVNVAGLHRKAVENRATTDGRMAGDAYKVGPDGKPLAGAKLRAWQIVRALVMAAKGPGTGVSHGELAARIGVSPKVLERAMSPSDGQLLTFEAVFELLGAEDLIAAHVIDAARAALVAEWGMVAVPAPMLTADEARAVRCVQAAGMSVGVAAGSFMGVLEAAADERSPGGCKVTACEAAAIAGRALAVHEATVGAVAVAGVLNGLKGGGR